MSDDPRDWRMFPSEDDERHALDYVASALRNGTRLGVLTSSCELLVLQGPIRQGQASPSAPDTSAPPEPHREEPPDAPAERR